jgi:Uma2 family endonuclease
MLIRNGAQLAWRIDPYCGSVAIYSADEAPQVLHRPEIVEGTAPVAGFQLKMAKVWTGK